MTFLINWLASLLVRRGFTKAAPYAGWFIWAAAIVVAVFAAWAWFLHFKHTVREEITKEVVTSINQATQQRMDELTRKVEEFNRDSMLRAEALSAQNVAFAQNTASLLSKVKSKDGVAPPQVPITVVTEKGECKINPEAAKLWNTLQKQLQQSAR